MSGTSSRNKGKRGEYLVRDYFRSLGFTANRVPSSGAATGFPGDVEVVTHDGKFLVEVKSRQNNFKSVYDLFSACAIGGVLSFTHRGICVDIVDSFSNFPKSNIYYSVLTEVKTQTLNKILNMQKLLKGCQYLVVKDNNKPLLFLRYQ